MANRKDSKPSATNGQVQENPEWPFRVLFSDGQVWDENKINKYHERLDDQDPRCDAWKDKLGSMLGRQLFPKDDRIFYLESLPSNYHMRVKTNGKDGRQDLYVYGYPGDKNTGAKSFRSPAEFFPHLLWLARGGDRKKEDCSCPLCNPSGKPRSIPVPVVPEPAPPGVPASVASGIAVSPAIAMNSSPRTSAKDIASATPIPKAKAAPAPPKAPPHPAATTTAQPNSTPIPPSTVSNQPTITPVPVPAAYSSPQAIPRPSHDTIFRGGEVVWYKNNFAWRLGIIIHTNPTGAPLVQPVKYALIPLAHNKFPVDCVEKPETDMRPFLAFSVPQLNKSISELNGRPMSEVDWESIQLQLAQNDPQRKEMLALEASKLAATLVDHSYSTFNPIGRLSADAEAFEGIFLGAEKICVGEAVRLPLPPEEINPQWGNTTPIVMVVKQIWVKSQTTDGLYFSGDIWRLQESNFQQNMPNQQQLPVPMQREKEFRDGVLRSRGLRVDWILIAGQVIKEEQAVRGRFYETRKLAPILNPETFQHSLAQGDVADLQALLNNRGDSNGPYVGRRIDRATTVAGAIPDNFLPAVASAT